MALFRVARNGCCGSLRFLSWRYLSSTSSTPSTKKMTGKPPVLPKVAKHDIPRLFQLSRQDPGIYRAEYHGDESEMGMNIYGGLLFAQGLESAQMDVEDDFLPTSFHSLFVSYPFAQQPVDYKVEKLRDGKSFCARYVKGVQNDQVVFAGIANFSKPSETSIYHTVKLPDVPKPDKLMDFFEYCEQKLAEIEAGKLKVPRVAKENFERRLFDKPYSVLDIKPVDLDAHFFLKSYKNVPMYYWIKSSIKLGDDPRAHRNLVAYLSDMFLVGSAIYPHISYGNHPGMVASLDNTLWFSNYNFKADEWLLYEVKSEVADSGRAVSHGKIWTINGQLIASTAQEVLARFTKQSKF